MIHFPGMLLRLSLLGSLLAVFLLLLLRFFLRGRVSHTLAYYLWLLVLLRLCLPVGVTLTLPLPEVQGTAQAVIFATHSPGNGAALPPSVEGEAAAPKPSLPVPSPQGPTAFSLRELLNAPAFWVALWGTGALISLGWYSGRYLRFSRRARQNLVAAPPEARAILAELDPTGKVQVGASSLVDTPTLIGVLAPTILLPSGLEEDRLRDILTHELTHARRRDLLYKWFAAGVTSLHWFNPLMSLIRKEISRLCELSCDEAVMSKMDAPQRKHYGETLLALAGAPPRLGPLTATLGEEKRRLRERLESLARPRKKSAATLALSLAAALMTGGCALILDAQPPLSGGEAPNLVVRDVLQAALEGDSPILYIGEDGSREVTISQVPALFSPDSDYARVWQFAIVDLDRDGGKEAVLQIIDAAGDMGGFLVLHWAGNDLYGFPQNYKTFQELKADGTFRFSDLAGTSQGVGRVTFRGPRRECELQPLFWQELYPMTGGVTCFIDGQQTSPEDFSRAEEEQRQKEDALWYSFTPEGIARAFPDFDNGEIAAALAEDFGEYWNSVSEGMVLPKVSIFQTDRFEGMDRAVFLVYPEYKTTHTVLYSVTDGTVTRLGDFPSGLEFSLSSSQGGMIRTTRVLEGRGSTETFHSYYRVSPEGIIETLSLGALTGSDGETAGYGIFRDGEAMPLSPEEYERQRSEADADFSEAGTVNYKTFSALANAVFDFSKEGEKTDLFWRHFIALSLELPPR